MSKLSIRIGAIIVFLWFLNSFTEHLYHFGLYPITDFPMFASGVPGELTSLAFNIYGRHQNKPIRCLPEQMLYPLDQQRAELPILGAACDYAVAKYRLLKQSQSPKDIRLRASIVDMWRQSASKALGANDQAEKLEILAEIYDLKVCPPVKIKQKVTDTIYFQEHNRDDISVK